MTRMTVLVREHLGLIAPLTLVAFVFLKVLRVARAQPSTTISLLSGSDKIAIAMGALLPLLYTVAAGTVISGAILTWRALHGRTRTHVVVAAGIFTAGLTLTMVLVPYPVLLVFPIVGLVMRAVWWATDHLPVPAADGAPVIKVFGIAAVVAVGASTTMWMLADERPWVAAERLTINGKVLVGYPIAEGDWVTILREDTRSIVRVQASALTDRAICEVQPTSALPSVVQLLANDDHPTTYERCEQ